MRLISFNSFSLKSLQIKAKRRRRISLSLSLMPTTPTSGHCTLIAIILRSMACLFRCFGVKDTNTHPPRLVSSSLDPTVAVPRSHNLSSLFHSQETEDATSELHNWQLNDEAKFLKACGTLVETPVEIRKSSMKLNDSGEQDSETLKFDSWLPNMSTSKLLEKDKLSGKPPSPIRFGKERATEPITIDSPTPSSCIINEQSDARISVSSLEDGVVESTIATVEPRHNGNSGMEMPKSAGLSACRSEFHHRCVRFETQSVVSESSPQTCIQNKENPEYKGDGSLLDDSPYPTPLNLTYSMQTPGTVFASGTNARIRSEYVYAAINPSEVVSLGAPENAKLTSKESMRVQRDTSVGTDLSSWLKPPASSGDERKPRPGRNQGDRPILGLVAEHWKEDEDVPRISPKQWDGNGIPNSTTKYKEDQKVHWHATPFEERLEKALSEESFISQRKPVNIKPVVFEDEEERDTATCKLQSLKTSKPLVSSC